MTAPKTDIDKQERRHKGPLWGMIVVSVVVLGLVAWWIWKDEPPGANNAPVEDSEPADGAAGSEASEAPVAAPEEPQTAQ